MGRARATCADAKAVLSTRISLVPLGNAKTVHLIRHAQGFHNVAGEKDRNEYVNPAYEDAHLTEKGWQQVESLHKHLAKLKDRMAIELIVVSPLTRTMQTAAGAFGSRVNSANQDSPLFMNPTERVEGRRLDRPAISAKGCPKIIACELCREQLGRNPCDRRRNISRQREKFPAADFSEVKHDADALFDAYGPNSRESVVDIQKRAWKFLQWLEKRPETNIAVVSHSAFLTLGLLPLFNGLPTHDPELTDAMGEYFQNCEMRSYAMTSAKALDNGSAGGKGGPLAFAGGNDCL